MSLRLGKQTIAGVISDTSAFATKTEVLNDCVHKTGDETIGGTKTFSSTPKVPRLACTSNGMNNNFDFQHSAKDGGWYLNADRLSGSNDIWYEIMPMVENYINGTSGYRIWANGYCEQWGASSTINATITLPKTYKDVNYNLIVGYAALSSATDSRSAYGQGGIVNSNTIYVRSKNSDGSYAEKVCWKTSGYLASGQY